MYTKLVQQSYDQTSKLIDQSLLQVRENILENVNTAKSTAKTICYYKKLRDFMDSDFDISGQELVEYNNELLPFLRTISILNPSSIYSVWVYCINTTIPPNWEKTFGIVPIEKYSCSVDALVSDKRQFWWDKGCKNNLVDYLPNLISKKEKDLNMFSYNYKIYSHSEYKLIGVLQIQIKTESLFSSLKVLEEKQVGKAFVVDENGIIVSDNYTDYYKKNIEEAFNTPGLMELCKKGEIASIAGVESIVGYKYINGLECSIVSIMPVSNIKSRIDKVRTVLLFIVISTFIVVLYLIFIVGRKLMKRVKILLMAMEEVEKENFSINVESGPLDEFGKLINKFNNMVIKIKELIDNIYKAKIQEKEAEFKALEAQINPHFLYNTLASISCLAKSNHDVEVSKMTMSLAKFYRLSLNAENMMITVEEELEHLKSYISIQRTRFKNMFDTCFVLDDNIYKYPIIKVILQPLVENALSHGIEPKMSHGTVVIKAWIEEDLLVFEIIDDGVGIRHERVEAILQNKLEKHWNSGYGLKNVNDRLKIYYGETYGIDVFSKIGIGTCVTIRIPVK